MNIRGEPRGFTQPLSLYVNYNLTAPGYLHYESN